MQCSWGCLFSGQEGRQVGSEVTAILLYCYTTPTPLQSAELHCAILFCTVLQWTVLHCTVLNCTARCYTTLCYTALLYAIMHCTVLHDTAQWCSALNWIDLSCDEIGLDSAAPWSWSRVIKMVTWCPSSFILMSSILPSAFFSFLLHPSLVMCQSYIILSSPFLQACLLSVLHPSIFD